MNGIMAHDNPKQMLFSISCESTRDKVAFLMAEAMAWSVGSETVQQAIDENSGLMRISVIAIARFGLFRSPEPAVFLSSYFYSK
jgi:hypothetical protein